MAAKKSKKQGGKPRAARGSKQASKAAAKQPAQQVAKAAAAPGGAAGLLAKASGFLREVQSELKKVTWPSRKQTISSTGVVLVLVIFVAVYLGLVDYILSRLVRLLIG